MGKARVSVVTFKPEPHGDSIPERTPAFLRDLSQPGSGFVMVLLFPCSFKQQNLEQRQADVEYELRCLLNKPGKSLSTGETPS